MTDRPEAVRMVHTWRGDTRQPIGKNGRLATPLSAAPAADVHAQRDGSALRRDIFQRALEQRLDVSPAVQDVENLNTGLSDAVQDHVLADRETPVTRPQSPRARPA